MCSGLVCWAQANEEAEQESRYMGEKAAAAEAERHGLAASVEQMRLAVQARKVLVACGTVETQKPKKIP